MNNAIYVSDETVREDLTSIAAQFGSDIIVALLAKLISEYHWWQWPSLKSALMKEMRSLNPDKPYNSRSSSVLESSDNSRSLSFSESSRKSIEATDTNGKD